MCWVAPERFDTHLAVALAGSRFATMGTSPPPQRESYQLRPVEVSDFLTQIGHGPVVGHHDVPGAHPAALALGAPPAHVDELGARADVAAVGALLPARRRAARRHAPRPSLPATCTPPPRASPFTPTPAASRSCAAARLSDVPGSRFALAASPGR